MAVTEVPNEPLKGEELMTKYNQLKNDGLSSKEIAIALGYVRGGRGGQTGNIMALQKALLSFLEPKTASVKAPKAARKPRGGRIANYRIQVQQNGNLLIGGAYTRRMGFEPGAEFEIQLGRKHIKLVHLGMGDESSLDDED